MTCYAAREHQTGKSHTIRNWYLAGRPRTLFASIAPVIVGSGLALRENKFVPVYALVALGCSALIQVGTNYVNDLYDFLRGADKAGRVGPKRLVASGAIPPAHMKKGIAVVFGAAFILGLCLVYAGGLPVLIIGILCIAAGIGYTSGPYPLAYHGLGDLGVFIFFGIIGTMGTYYVQAREITWLAFLSSIPVGALITNILVVNNYRDIEQDRTAGKNTLAVMIGKRLSRYEYISLASLAIAVPPLFYFAFGMRLWIFMPYLAIPLLYRAGMMLWTLEGTDLNRALERTSVLCAIYALLFALGLVL